MALPYRVEDQKLFLSRSGCGFSVVLRSLSELSKTMQTANTQAKHVGTGPRIKSCLPRRGLVLSGPPFALRALQNHAQTAKTEAKSFPTT